MEDDLKNLKEIISGLNITEEEFKNQRILQTIQNYWKELIGPIYFNHSVVKSYFAGTLQVVVDHTAYKQEILFIKSNLIILINKLFKSNPVYKIDIIIGKVTINNNDVPRKLPDLSKKEDLLEQIANTEDEKIKNKFIDLIKFLN